MESGEYHLTWGLRMCLRTRSVEDENCFVKKIKIQCTMAAVRLTGNFKTVCLSLTVTILWNDVSIVTFTASSSIFMDRPELSLSLTAGVVYVVLEHDCHNSLSFFIWEREREKKKLCFFYSYVCHYSMPFSTQYCVYLWCLSVTHHELFHNTGLYVFICK